MATNSFTAIIALVSNQLHEVNLAYKAALKEDVFFQELKKIYQEKIKLEAQLRDLRIKSHQRRSFGF